MLGLTCGAVRDSKHIQSFAKFQLKIRIFKSTSSSVLPPLLLKVPILIFNIVACYTFFSGVSPQKTPIRSIFAAPKVNDSKIELFNDCKTCGVKLDNLTAMWSFAFIL